MSEKVPVRIEWVDDQDGGGEIEVAMAFGDFTASDTSITARTKRFKKRYLEAIEKAKKTDAESSTRTSRAVSTGRRWRACKILADFNAEASNEFEITNYKEAYARDFGLPVRSIRTYLDFGSHFAEEEVLDGIPYSVYAELIFRMNGLRTAGRFEAEKKHLIKAGRAGKPPNRDEYRERLKGLLSPKIPA